MKNVFTSIDIGSSNIKVVVCELSDNKLNVLASSSVKSRGIKRGVITNSEAACESVGEAISKVESMLGIGIDKAIVNIPAYSANFNYLKGAINIVNEEHKVRSEEIVELLATVRESKLSADEEMVTIIPIDFKIDGVATTKPFGKVGNVISTRAIMISTPKKNVYSVLAIMKNVGIDVVDIMIDGIGNVNTFQSKGIDESVGAIVDIGSETTTVSVYNKGIIVKNSIIGVGSTILDNDISFAYKISPKEAKKIKEKFAFASKKYASVNDFFETKNENEENIKVNQFEVSELIENRLNEIMDLVKKELANLLDCDVDYILFTGGTSDMDHFDYILNENFGKKAHVGRIDIVGCRKNSYSVALGNIIYFINKLKLKGKSYSMISPKDCEELSSAKRNSANLVSESKIGIVTQYFFGE